MYKLIKSHRNWPEIHILACLAMQPCCRYYCLVHEDAVPRRLLTFNSGLEEALQIYQASR